MQHTGIERNGFQIDVFMNWGQCKEHTKIYNRVSVVTCHLMYAFNPLRTKRNRVI